MSFEDLHIEYGTVKVLVRGVVVLLFSSRLSGETCKHAQASLCCFAAGADIVLVAVGERGDGADLDCGALVCIDRYRRNGVRKFESREVVRGAEQVSWERCCYDGAKGGKCLRSERLGDDAESRG